jgi:hypothetical protein
VAEACAGVPAAGAAADWVVIVGACEAILLLLLLLVVEVAAAGQGRLDHWAEHGGGEVIATSSS